MDFVRNFVYSETSYQANIASLLSRMGHKAGPSPLPCRCLRWKGENAEAVKQLELYLKAAPNSKETEQIKNLIKELNKKAVRE